MADKKQPTPKEIPLHEVVLSILYQANKERPAELKVEEVFHEVQDQTISEIQISQVLKWLVSRDEVEYASGKYKLDRFSFLDERKKDMDERGEELNSPNDLPLHDVVLNAMFELSEGDKPTKLTLDDIFWKISDPKVLRTHLGDVLKWLQNQGRVEYSSGRYNLDSIEFQDQKKASATPVPKKPIKKKVPVKKKTEEAKVVIPPAPKKEEVKEKIVKPEEKVEKKPEPRPESKEVVEVAKPKEKTKKKLEPQVEPEKVQEVIPPKEKVEKKPEVPVAPKKVEEVIQPQEEVKKKKEVEVQKQPEDKTLVQHEANQTKWRKPVFVAAIVCLTVTFYLLYRLSETIPTASQDATNGILIGLVSLNAILLVIVVLLFYRKD